MDMNVDEPSTAAMNNNEGDRPPGGHGHTHAPIPPLQNQFGAVRDRLFHAMLVKVALGYSSAVPPLGRKLIECAALLAAICLLCLLLFVHFMSSRMTTSCLDGLTEEWPKVKDGVIRVDVIRNLDMYEYKYKWIDWYRSSRSQMQCRFNPRDVLMYGPQAIPAEIRQARPRIEKSNDTSKAPHSHGFEAGASVSRRERHGLLSYFLRSPVELFAKGYEPEEDEESEQEEYDEELAPGVDPIQEEAESAFADNFKIQFDEAKTPKSLLRIEYSLYYGLLRLPLHFRTHKKIETKVLRLDSASECFGDPLMRWTLENLLGYEEAVSTSLRQLAANESMDDGGLGYLHNLETNEHFHFVGGTMSRTSYLMAAVVMVIFTFAISLLLRFSHHQIFVFIVDLLHMFELNQPLQFPAAPLLTVILALVGMEAIMSEVFNDTSTAFYVILVVWIADQFDAICCHTPTSKRYWLRFFYLYQFFFYAYQYRFGGHYGGLALIASTSFIVHSMIFFFHHYEMPLILYQERLQRILSEIQTTPPMMPTTTTAPAAPAAPVAAPAPTVPHPSPASSNNQPNSTPATATSPPANTTAASSSGAASLQRLQEELPVERQNPLSQLSPSSVFDARTPPPRSPVRETEPDPEPIPSDDIILNAEQQVAESVVNEAIEELFQT